MVDGQSTRNKDSPDERGRTSEHFPEARFVV